MLRTQLRASSIMSLKTVIMLQTYTPKLLLNIFIQPDHPSKIIAIQNSTA
jgi:hypothetical protein